MPIKPNNKPWGGRFDTDSNKKLEQFNASVHFDHKLAPFDIQVSMAHANMLEAIHILTKQENAQIQEGLQHILEQINNHTFNWSIALEDVHMNIEKALTDHIGPVGKKLHTARSRNDQVATDIRLYLRHHSDHIAHQISRICHSLIKQASQHIAIIMPGYTHLQNAQPVLFSHHLMAWFEMLFRDLTRLSNTRKHINQLPLGAAALAGSPYPVDRQYLATALQFEGICENSMDAVSDRDFAIEFTSNASLTMMHLSRMCEEIILWMSTPFSFITLPDTLCTGSSIMPQKKNPDIPELIRGKTGRVYGHLQSLLTLMKSQPLAYNKDNQEDKEAIFDTTQTLLACTDIFSDIIINLEPQPEQMRQAAALGYTNATDLADYLTKKGIPFRDAHHITGQIVKHALLHHNPIEALDIKTLQTFCSKIEPDIMNHISLEAAINARNTAGGTSTKQVQHAIEQAKKRMQTMDAKIKSTSIR